MAILPKSKPGQSGKITKEVLERYSLLTPPERHADKVKVLVVRGYFRDSMGKVGHNDRRLYDDAIFIQDGAAVVPFNANCDPAVYRYRVASIAAPQAIRYKPGWHGYGKKSGHNAFRQNSNCTVNRDKYGPTYGMYHVNLHRGGYGTTSSLGCITIHPSQWSDVYRTLKNALDRHKQKTFYLTIVEYQGGNPPTDPFEGIMLERGDANPVVSWLIDALTQLNLYVGANDGAYGPMTEQSVEAFQDEAGLVQDGKAGPKTLRAIYKAITPPKQAVA